MMIREAKPEEIQMLLKEGHRLWHKNRTFEQYYEDNRKEDEYGTRYVADIAGKPVSSLILLRLQDIGRFKVYGIGSVFTLEEFKGNGYALRLLEHCKRQVDFKDSLLFLYSEINPSYYERVGFYSLPKKLQKKQNCTCMVCCPEEAFKEICDMSVSFLPDYF